MSSETRSDRDPPRRNRGAVARGLVVLAATALGVALLVSLLRLYLDRQWDETAVRGALSVMEGNPEIGRNEQLLAASAEAVAVIVPEGAHDRLPADDAPRTAPASDPEWVALERTSFSLAWALDRPELLVARKLFRNRSLNPTDCYIALERRREIEAWLPAACEKLALAKANVHTIAVQELDYLVQRGVAPRKAYSEYVAELDDAKKALVEREIEAARKELEDGGASAVEAAERLRRMKVFPVPVAVDAFATSVRDDDIWFADLRILPQARAAADLYVAGVSQLHGRLYDFFGANAGLTVAAIAKSIADVDRALRSCSAPPR